MLKVKVPAISTNCSLVQVPGEKGDPPYSPRHVQYLVPAAMNLTFSTKGRQTRQASSETN